MSHETENLAEVPAAPEQESQYDSESVKIFKDTAHIRERPGMYIGDTSTKGLHHLVYELVYNSVDEALAGHCKNITVKVNPDGSLSVSDDGRGIPVEPHPATGRSTLEVVMTTVGAGAKFDKNTYKVSAGLHGIGAKAVTALSEWVEAEVRRNGKTYFQEYERGKPTTEVTERGAATRTGTRITFKPDPDIFKDAVFEYSELENRLRELAFLNKGLSIHLVDSRTNREDKFKYDGGIAEYVEHLNNSETVLHKPPIYIDKTILIEQTGAPVRVEVALQYTTADRERVVCYANNAYNSMGGTHLIGLRTALTRTLGAYGNKQNLFKNDLKPTGEDYREGLTAVVSVQVPEPQLEAQTKIRLNNPEVEGAVASVVSEQLGKYLEENPRDAQQIMKKVIAAAEIREALAKQRKAMKERKGLLSGGGLPGKLLDCTTKDREGSELFLVEGDSAGGSADSGRDREYQAILPLRGKPLNVEKTKKEALLDNKEIASLISAIGLNLDNQDPEEARKSLRYGKVIILTDADVDGQHIRTLLLTFFYRQAPQLVLEKRIWVARPPLYKVTEKKHVRFVQTAEEMHRELLRRGLLNAKLNILPPEGQAETQPRVVTGEELEGLLQIITRLERALQTLEQRGINLSWFIEKRTERGLPIFRVLISGREQWCHTREEVDALKKQEQQRLGRELVVGEEPGTNGDARDTVFEQELHEVREVNKSLPELAKFGLVPHDLVPQVRLAGREPAVRLRLDSGEQQRVLSTIRDLIAEVRRLGEKGMSITRFKGLGEMNPEELWETTLDPEKRTLLCVRLEDALKADEMFRTLMGDKVEPRRDFIVKYALEVKDLDYHGA